jgi:hypothetical protein
MTQHFQKFHSTSLSLFQQHSQPFYCNISQMVSWKLHFSFQEPLLWRQLNSRTRENMRLFLLLTSSNSIWVTHNAATCILKYIQYSVLSWGLWFLRRRIRILLTFGIWRRAVRNQRTNLYTEPHCLIQRNLH